MANNSDYIYPSPGTPGFRDYRQNVALEYVKQGYNLMSKHAFTLLLLPIAAFLLCNLGGLYTRGYVSEIWEAASNTDLQFNLLTFAGCALLLVLVAVTYVFLQNRPVYLLDFELYKPPDNEKVSHREFMEGSISCQKFDEASLRFQEKIMSRSGLGDETYLPRGITKNPSRISLQTAREEAAAVMFTTIENLFRNNNMDPTDIDILVVNCSLFNPTPSLSAMIINHFKMKSNIIVYNLAGMGCSAGLIAIDLARQLLQIYPSSKALVFSTENITQNWYFGNNRSMLIPNCLFRIGGAAILLTNKRRLCFKAKYELKHLVRTHMGADDSAYTCVYQMEDENNIIGVRLSKELMAVAGEALKANITTLGPLVLPIIEQISFFVNFVYRKIFKQKIKPYIPNFSLAFEHFCIHPGGKGVLEEIEKQLNLSKERIKPSKDTLFRYGNTSSSSVWYILGNIESKGQVNRGDRVWQIAFGSGFKCNSAVWQALRQVDKLHEAWT